MKYKAADAESWTSGASDHAGTTLTISGVDSAKSYTVRVKAKNAGGASAWTQSAAAVAPAPVTSLTVVRLSVQLVVGWNASARADAYDVEYRADGAASWVSAAADYASATLIITGIDAAETYVVRVKATNAGGTLPARRILEPPLPGQPGRGGFVSQRQAL